MTEYNRISDGNFTPTSNIPNGKNNKLFANLLPCDNMSNECEEQAYNSLPPMSSPCYDPPPNTSITTRNNQSSNHEDGQNMELRAGADAAPLSPRVPPMAFTIDFGSEDVNEASTPKRLGLRDGIGRFAPSKKFRERPKSPRHVPTSKNLQTTPSAASTTTITPANNDLLSLRSAETNRQQILGADAVDSRDDFNLTIDTNKQENIDVERSAVVMSLTNEPKHNEFVKGFVTHKANASLHTTTFVTKTRERISPVDVVIDEENNIASNEATFNTTNNTLERSGSDAGTYTIDNDEEENQVNESGADNTQNKYPNQKLNGEVAKTKEKPGILGGGIKDEKINTHEWVNIWATNNSLIMNKDNKETDDINAEHQYEDDFEEEEEEESSLSSIRGGEGDGSRSRRKLPTVPSPTNRVGINNNTLKSMTGHSDPMKHDQNTDDYLKDTISLMAAMEARLGNGDDESPRSQHLFQRTTTHQSQTNQSYNSRSAHLPQHLRNSHGVATSQKPSNKVSSSPHGNVKSNVPAGSAASIEQAKKAKELAAWKARKSYDPLKAANINKKPVGQQHQMVSSNSKRPSSNNLMTNHEGDVDSYSEDTCSDLDAASSVSQQAYHRQQQAAALSSASASNRFHPTMHARTNRAFALRQTNSLHINENVVTSTVGSSTINGSPKRTPSEESFNRSDGGRWSLRNKKNGVGKGSPSNTGANKNAAMASSIHRVQPSTKKKSVGVRNVMNGGRSTSSLSSREVEFQAWKRRKNYDPLRSAQSANKRTTTSHTSSVTSNIQSTSQTQVTVPSAPAIRRGTITKTSSVFQHTANVPSSLQPREAVGDYSNLLRSASFHYPDGLSRVQLNVYTSEDDDESQVGANGDFPAGLYEVNEDELILTIGGGGGEDNGSESMISMRPSNNKNQTDGSRASPSSMSHWPPSAHSMQPSHKMTRSSPSRGSSNKLEALDNLVISTIFSVSAKLCLTSSTLMRQLQEQTTDKEQMDYLDTLLYVLEDVDPPMSPSKKTSRELAGTLRNLKKVEQALQTLLTSDNSLSLAEDPSEEAENDN